MSQHILIAEDDANVSRILERTLRSGPYTLHVVASGKEALEAIEHQIFDLYLLDLNLGMVSGLQVFEAARRRDPDAVAIILTGHSSIESAVNALRLGAFDYLIKPTSPETIRQRVQEGLAHREASMRRKHLLAQISMLRQALVDLETENTRLVQPENDSRFLRSETGAGSVLIDLHQRVVTLGGRLLELTTTEFDLLVCLMRAAPQPLTPRALVATVLQYEVSDQEAAELIKGHIHHLRAKIEPLGAANPKLIKTIRHRGYLWAG